MADPKQAQKLLAQILRGPMPNFQMHDEDMAAMPGDEVQRSPGHAVQTAHAYAAPDESAHDAGHISYEQGRIPEREIYDLPTSYVSTGYPHAKHNPNAQVLPENGGMEMGEDGVQRMPSMTVHPHWQMLHDIIGAMSGRSSDPLVHQAGEE